MTSNLKDIKEEIHRNNFYKKLFKEMNDFIIVFSISTDHQFHSQIVSKSIYDLFELSREHNFDYAIRYFYDSIFKEDKFSLVRALNTSRKEAKSWEMEFRISLPKKEFCWFKVSSKSKLQSDGSSIWYCKFLDITDFKLQQSQLSISEKRFRFALEASTSGIWDWDLRTNKVFYSAQSLKILEQESKDVFDSPELWDKIVHPDDLKEYYDAIHNHFENKTSFYENVHRVLTSNGNYKWILDRGKVIERNSGGKPLRVIGTHTDVSFQKEKQLELKRMMESYHEHNTRLLNFSHIVSHNLNLHAGNITLLLDMIDLEKKSAENMETLTYLRTVSDDLNLTIKNLSQIVNIQNNLNVLKESLDLNLYLEKNSKIISGYGHEIKATIIINVPKKTFVNFNPAYLESVLLNFSTNAIKYTHPDRFPEIKFDFFIENEQKTLTISDNGLGIDLEKHGKDLFGLYKTFHNHKNGHGIGLYITKNQIEAMNAKVSVESKVGEGSIFKIIFSE